MVKLDLVYNPVAGNFREERLTQLVAAFAANGFSAEPLATSPEGAQLSGTADLVCVLGGDGALRETVRAVAGDIEHVPICIAPSGTINLVARELGYRREPEALALQIARAWLSGPDSWVKSPLFRLGETPIVSCLSLGPDSQAVAAVSGDLKRRLGRYAYVVAMMRQLVSWPREAVSISGELADGTPFETDAEATILARGALYAGPFRLSPKAGLASETVELITLRRSTRLSALAFASAAMVRLPVGRMGLAEIRSIRRAKIGDCSIPVQVDGDHMPGCTGEITPTGLSVQYCV